MPNRRPEGIDPSARTLRLEHDPIPELDWPAMTMNFRVQDSVAIGDLAAGQTIHFSMVREGDAWVIDRIHIMNGKAGGEGHQHD